MARAVRDVFEGVDVLIPEVLKCGRSEQSAAHPGLPPHVHQDAFEFCLIQRGEVEWWVQDRVFAVAAGEVYFTRPGERHGGIGSMMHPCELYWFQVCDPDGGPLAPVCADLEELSIRTFRASSELQTSMRSLVEEHRHRDTSSALAARASLHRSLVLFLREAKAARNVALSAPVRTALAWMSRRMNEPFTVADVADAVGLSVVRLQARFKRELHSSVGAHRTRLRLHAARLQLRHTDKPVTVIAHELGFASSQYFATVFRQHVGVTPSAYRADTAR